MLSLRLYGTGSWTHTQSIGSHSGGGKDFEKFSDGGVAVYADTVVVGSTKEGEIQIFDNGTYEASVAISDVLGVSIYGLVITAVTDSSVYIIEKMSSAWTSTATLSPGGTNFNVQIYGSVFVVGNTGTILIFSLITDILCSSLLTVTSCRIILHLITDYAYIYNYAGQAYTLQAQLTASGDNYAAIYDERVAIVRIEANSNHGNFKILQTNLLYICKPYYCITLFYFIR
jgi:hypothetical protein